MKRNSKLNLFVPKKNGGLVSNDLSKVMFSSQQVNWRFFQKQKNVNCRFFQKNIKGRFYLSVVFSSSDENEYFSREKLAENLQVIRDIPKILKKQDPELDQMIKELNEADWSKLTSKSSKKEENLKNASEKEKTAEESLKDASEKEKTAEKSLKDVSEKEKTAGEQN